MGLFAGIELENPPVPCNVDGCGGTQYFSGRGYACNNQAAHPAEGTETPTATET